MAKELCLVQDNEIGREIRRYFIERDKKLTAIEDEIRKQIRKGQIQSEYYSKMKNQPHAFLEELLNKIYVLGGNEAHEIANMISDLSFTISRR